ncbi:hypothetical protein J1N35_032932 [Gossypium stocksii]|uniref:Uncharacterized protein n=1 Tax=Gossypium stocksii TaxID=47602 RepID=A0A9D3UP71_9ROSI|nr:hypothetical protein J1N35_032932 [Gossypium stocksii]
MRDIQAFREMIENLSCIDLNFKGLRFARFNTREDGLIEERIDRALGTLSWMGRYPSAQVFNLLMVGSDHPPMLVDTEVKDKKGPKQFKFEVMWASWMEDSG